MTAVPLVLATQSDNASAVLMLDLANSIAALLDFAHAEIDDNQESAKATIARASSLLKVELDRQATFTFEAVTSGRLAGWQVHRLRMFVDAHLDQAIHIKDLAAVAQRSAAYFSRVFKRTFGETPHTFVVSRRLHRVRHLMLTTDLSLSEIAMDAGFADQAHLCRLFRQTNGQSPAAWRRERRDSLLSACDRPRSISTSPAN